MAVMLAENMHNEVRAILNSSTKDSPTALRAARKGLAKREEDKDGRSTDLGRRLAANGEAFRRRESI